MKKCIRFLAFFSGICLFATSSFICVQAYLSSHDKADNEFGVGENNIIILEPDFTPPPQLVKDGVYPKTVQIKNTKGVDTYVRIRLVCSDDRLWDYLDFDWNQINWIKDEESCLYYYKKAISEGETTVPLITKAIVKQTVTQEQLDELGNVSLEVVAESCQKGSFQTYQDAWRQLEKNKERERIAK